MGIIWCDYCGVAGRKAITGPPLIDDAARRRAAPSIGGGVSVGSGGLVNAVTTPSGALGVWEGSPSMV